MKRLIIFCFLFSTINLFAQTPELIFHSGFEPNVMTDDHSSSSIDIIGVDGSVSAPNDWENDLEDHPNIGSFKVQFQGGDETERMAEIAPDPTDPSVPAANNALQFWIKEPNSGNNGRVQGNIYGNNGLYNLFYSVRLYLPADFNLLKNAPFDFKFLTLAEFWNNANWTDEDYMFRMKINLAKVVDDPDSLRIRVTGQAREEGSGEWGIDVWDMTNLDYVVPVQKWMTLKVYFVEGDEDTGRFTFSIQPDGEPETVIYDVHNFTHHPDSPNPDGMSHFNPIKLYTSDELVEYVTDEGGMLNVFWDDFELWKDSLLTSSNIDYTCLPSGYQFTAQSEIDDFAANYPTCHSILGDVTIESGSSDPITNLDGLSQISFIDGFLKIKSNNSLADLEGLENLDYIGGDLTISDNAILESLDGLHNINAGSIDDLKITDNSNLSTCDVESICNYLEDPEGDVSISDNATDCNSEEEVEADCGIVGVANIAADSRFSIYPNPAKTAVFISAKDATIIHEINVYNQVGQKVLHKNQLTEEIDVSKLKQGIYIIELVSDDSRFSKRMIII